MSARRILVATIAATSIYCGGQLVVDQPLGHGDSDGGYVLPDGAPAFIAGHGCNGYTSTQLICGAPPDPSSEPCSYGWQCKDDRPYACATMARASLPFGYPFFAGCIGDPMGSGNDCVFNQQIPFLGCSSRSGGDVVDVEPLLACHAGPDGDAFCSSYLTQYVLGDGAAAAKCTTACTITDGFDGICATTTGAGYSAITPVGQACGPNNDCDGLSMCVTRNGASKCELPCTP